MGNGMAGMTLADIEREPHPDFDRLLSVLWRRRRPDRVPFYELLVNPPFMEKVLGRPVPDRAATVEFYHRLGYDYVPAWPGLPLPVGSLVDTRLGYPIVDRDSFGSYPWPSASEITFTECDAVSPILPAGMRIIAQTGGIFETAVGLFGYRRLCELLFDDRRLVAGAFERLGALYEAMYAGMARIPAVGALVISDDLGFKGQTLLSPRDLRELVLPWHRKIARIIHDSGKPCILHSCGNLAEIMDDLIDDVGIDAKHSFEDGILPVVEAYRLYGDRIAILGGFDVDRLCRSTLAEIRRHVDVLLDEVGDDGGYALGSGNSIPEFVPVDAYLTMMDQGWRRGEGAETLPWGRASP